MTYQLIIPAGGLCTRMGADYKDMHKSLLTINDETLLERLIREYCEAGVSRIILLTSNDNDSIEYYIESNYNPSNIDDLYLTCISDPPSGKAGVAGAILNAIETGVVDKRLPSIVHNPDDLILADDYVRNLTAIHHENTLNGAVASMVLVHGIRVPYSIVKSQYHSILYDIEKRPILPHSVHTGVTLLNSETYPVFEEHVQHGKDMSIEPAVISQLIETKQVRGIWIQMDEWVPINTHNEYESAKQRLKQ
jgi:NDP-sugar pyrophosphorylase family protein